MCLVKHWYLGMTYSLIFLARHALPALLCPWKDTKQPIPNSRWKHKSKREGKVNREDSSYSPWTMGTNPPPNKQHNPKHVLQRRPKSTITASGVYTGQCAIIALLAKSKPVVKSKDMLGLLSIFVIPVWAQSHHLEMQPKRALLVQNSAALEDEPKAVPHT